MSIVEERWVEMTVQFGRTTISIPKTQAYTDDPMESGRGFSFYDDTRFMLEVARRQLLALRKTRPNLLGLRDDQVEIRGNKDHNTITVSSQMLPEFFGISFMVALLKKAFLFQPQEIELETDNSLVSGLKDDILRDD
jgi:hypothetical protein